MENDDVVATLCIKIIANAVKIIRKRQRRRRQILDTKAKSTWSSSCILQELTTEDPDDFRNFLRMEKADFVSSTHAC